MKLNDIYKKIDDLNEAASMNISLTGDSPQEVGELFKVLGDKDLNPEPMPSLGMRGDIEKSMDIMKKMDGPKDGPMPMKMPSDMPTKLTMQDEPSDNEDYANSPDEQHQDTKYMTKDLAGGLNKEKKSYPKVAGGDNPMALENKIKEELKAKFAEKFGEAKEDSFDEAGCKKEMKRLDASGCSKNEMLKKVDSKFGCGKEKFEKLYASSCGGH
jgi:hypothetical protein